MHQVTSKTRVYGVIGNPVAHSLGPVMHNRAFLATGWPGIYAAFAVSDIAAAVTGVRGLDIAGISVTIPYKQAVMAHLDHVDEAARRIGAVNTVTNHEGVLSGTNTDAAGLVRALAGKTPPEGRDVLILGAGGAARAAGWGLLREGARIHIANRSEEKGRALAKSLGAGFYPLSRLDRAPCDILINTTPVGMHPRTEEMPVPAEILHKNMTVMDIIYNPLKTSLLQAAEAAGARIIDGVPMFVCQGALQFELWTGLSAPVELMENAVYEALQG